MKIRSKTEFFAMWKAGLLGNRTQQWSDPQEAWDANIPTGYGFREHRAGGGSWEHAPREQFWETYWRWTIARRIFTIDDGVPDQYQTLQGEVCRTFRGLEGFIGATKMPMRRAIAAGLLRPYGAAETFVLLNTYMDPSSRDDLDMLLELYPDATVEFTCFSVNVGNIPNRNTIFWETRDY